MHQLLAEHQRLVDFATFTLAGLALGTLLSQVAVIVTILAGLASLALALIRIHDRLRYGRVGE